MSWRSATLSELGVQIQSGFASGRHGTDGDVAHLRPMNITRRGGLTLEGSKFVAGSAGSSRVVAGDILFNNTNSPSLVGKTAYVGIAGLFAFSNHMTRLRMGPDLEPRFVALQLQNLQEIGYFESICSNHVNQASVSGSRLMQVEVRIPDLDEQRRIVGILEDHLSRLDAAEGSLSQALVRSTRMRESMLDAAIWTEKDRCPLGRLLREEMRNGHSARASMDGSGVRTLTITAVTRKEFIDAHTKRTVAEPSRISRLWLRDGDILVQRANTPKLVGSSAIYHGATTGQSSLTS